MKRSVAITVAVVAIAVLILIGIAGCGSSGGVEDERATEVTTEEQVEVEPAVPTGQTTTVTGEVVELACYLANNLTGPKHAVCAVSCAEGGAPLGILDKKAGKAYLIVLDHGDLMGAKSDMVLKKFKPYIAKDVIATGKIIQRGGLTGIAVASVKAAN